MNRRQLLKSLLTGGAVLAGGVAIPAVARTIFLPPRGGWPVDPRCSWSADFRGWTYSDEFGPIQWPRLSVGVEVAYDNDVGGGVVVWDKKTELHWNGCDKLPIGKRIVVLGHELEVISTEPDPLWPPGLFRGTLRQV